MSTSSSPQITFPLKLSYPIDIDKPIYKYIKHNCSEFYEEERDKANAKAFNDLREKALHQNIDANKKSTDTLAHYYDQLKMLLPKVPILPNNSTANAVRINFTWHNAYDTKRDKVVKQSGHFELLCVLYNLACVKLLIASQANQSEEADLLMAMKHNQAAAGYFDYLCQAMVKTVGTEKVTNDLVTPSLQAYSAVCLAQAQEMIIKSPKAQKMKMDMRAGLTKHCAELFGKARTALGAALQKPKNSVEICECKYYFYSGQAELHQANAVAAGPNHGEAIKRCDIAREFLTKAQKKAPKNFNGIKELLSQIDTSQTQFRKDNDWIYHCGIPNSVSSITPKPIAKPTPFDEKSFASSEPIHDIFEAIVPVQIQQAMITFEEKRKRMIGERLMQIQEKNNHMTSVVQSLGVDSLLDKIFRNLNGPAGGASNLPPNIKTAADKVKASGGYNKLIQDKDSIISKQQVCKDMINESFNMLNAEAEQDKQNREKFGVNKFDGFNWSAEPSERANHMLMQELNKYNGILGGFGWG